MKRPVQAIERNIRSINVKITNAAGTLAVVGEGVTAEHDSTGVVTVTLTKPGKLMRAAHATVIEDTGATGHYAKVSDMVAATSLKVRTFVADGTDGAPADVDFFLSVVVKDSEA